MTRRDQIKQEAKTATEHLSEAHALIDRALAALRASGSPGSTYPPPPWKYAITRLSDVQRVIAFVVEELDHRADGAP